MDSHELLVYLSLKLIVLCMTVWYSQRVTKHNDKKPIPLAGLLEKRNSIWLRIWFLRTCA